MQVVNENENGKVIILKVKETLEINLIENASTGYTWIEEITPNQILSLDKEEFVQNSITHGGNTIHRWHFKGERNGQKKLRFIYQRPWVKDQHGVKEFEVTVHVSD
ncbi:protease inhibitor I42 family protein [Bacillus atrophaeus]|uniref:protease inhibitor I42 family protein n=1 Tax=Bacillus atrophaeus TaxID=1452 RepID=UPI002280FF28|nr:protease inhibitor I42 family protein [Bacillus atrophaeus]MCY8499345.1 protease inhibitor I42 family protein [Bacillus atrophaeus]MCY8823238.1 protease inhibitor I42 family protein [Bacillus atrophaeus]MCY8830241.1 protease inhibitor I42 family protein [Bacillus atrophaeus]MCY8835309.1 protease inhibitor I42 family protein [Bacillus atrophaeus]MCY8856533.1 protease inhibitor I42 family protein [Bacillus atrophaeus]